MTLVEEFNFILYLGENRDYELVEDYQALEYRLRPVSRFDWLSKLKLYW